MMVVHVLVCEGDYKETVIRNKLFIKLERLCFENRIVETFVKH